MDDSPASASGHRFRSQNFSFDFGGHHDEQEAADRLPRISRRQLINDGQDDACDRRQMPVAGFRTPGGAANTAEILKFLIDRTGYIKLLEEEDTPEAYSRIENLANWSTLPWIREIAARPSISFSTMPRW